MGECGQIFCSFEASVTSFGPLLSPWSLSSMKELIFSSFLFTSRTIVFLSQFLLSETSISIWINPPTFFQFVISSTPLIYLHPSRNLYSVIYHHLTLGNIWSYNSKHPNFHPWFPIFLAFKNPYLSQHLFFFFKPHQVFKLMMSSLSHCHWITHFAAVWTWIAWFIIIVITNFLIWSLYSSIFLILDKNYDSYPQDLHLSSWFWLRKVTHVC